MKRKDLKRKYYELYDKAMAIKKNHNPCAIFFGECARGRAGDSNFCCNTGYVCKYLSDDGCTTKALSCSLWYCEYAFKNMPNSVVDEILSLREEASKLNLLYFREGDKVSLKRASGFGFGKTVRKIYRFINLSRGDVNVRE